VALEAREEIAIEKAQVAVGEVVGGLMLPAEKKAIDAMLVEAEREGVVQCRNQILRRLRPRLSHDLHAIDATPA
jgi:hypothetical protein